MIDFDIRKRFQPKPQNTVGLDIGSHSVKILEVTPPSAGRRTLISFGLKKIQGLPREAVAASVRNLFEELKISVKDVALSLSGPPLIARVISMPKMSDDELKGAVRFETEKLIPFDISECILDYQILSPAVKGKANAEILLAAVKRDQVMQKVKTAEEAG